MACEFRITFYLIAKMSLITSQSETADDTIIALGAFIVARRLGGCKRWAVQPLNQRKSSMGAYYTLVQELGIDDEMFQKYFRCNREQFSTLLDEIRDEITVFHRSSEVLCPRQRLAISLR